MRTQACLGGRSPEPERREANFGGRACVRRAGCSERGTLNASTVENPIGSYRQFALLSRDGDEADQTEMPARSVRATEATEMEESGQYVQDRHSAAAIALRYGVTCQNS
jgi:hypothetical protein